ncbi:ABC transporter substrate-binding protein [Paludibacterium paludis]|uniref:ABC transporter substrate-binding protein n=1 Tax=Paludibacterium paludis TaxID=1225769 RepID=A0A918P0S3_9NEIS|nr:ABC transporter substrate-binding protein [Paludibacterium paludis]GGY10436.1 ABC transporter substrate-binding protein [Paludibacterium paludis]
MRTARLLVSALFLSLAAVSTAKPLAVCTDASPEGFDVVQYNSLVTTNASADVLMNRLVEFDETARKVVPSLAVSWKISPDGLNYEFALRRGVAFHSTPWFKPGRPFNADDVVQTFDRMLNPGNPWFKTSPTGYPHAQSLSLNKLIRRIVKVDPYTVRFELNYPDATFLSDLTMGFASIYSAEYLERLLAEGRQGDLNQKPVGTGPFVFSGYVKDSVVRYQANPAYFGGRPKASALIFAITPDAATRYQRLAAGECQIAVGLKPQDVASARANRQLRVLEAPAFMTAFVAFNTRKKPFDDVRVRKAVNLAFDRQAYLSGVFAGSASPATLVFPPSAWGYARDVKPWPHDIAAAKKLMAEAGLGSGVETTLWVRPSGSVLNPNPRLGAELLQSDLAKIGIRAQIRVIEWGELIKRGKAGEHDLLFMGWSGDNGDPDNFLTPQFSCAAVESGTNFARVCDPKLDGWIKSAKATSDVKTRTGLYRNAQKLIHDDALWLPLAHPTAYGVTRATVTGWHVSPFGRLHLETAAAN